MTESQVYELIGYAASVLTIASLLMAQVLRLRMVNFGASGVWAVYGYLIHAPAVIVTNVILMGVNLFFIIRLLSARELFNMVEVRKDSAFLKQFLAYYGREILRIYPDFTYDQNANLFTFFAFRNVTAAGLFIVEIRADGNLYLKLEFTIPGYQDFKISKYVYSKDSPVLKSVRENGFEKVYSDFPKEPGQAAYLEKMGYKPDSSKKVMILDIQAL